MTQQSRQVTEYQFFALHLADMRGNVDRTEAIAVFTTMDNLIRWVASQEGSWTDDTMTPDNFGRRHNYSKAYRKGTPLEWYNPAVLEPKRYREAFGGVQEIWSEKVDGWVVPLDPSPVREPEGAQ